MMIQGLGISRGIGIGTVYKLAPFVIPEERNDINVEDEIKKVQEGVISAVRRLEMLKEAEKKLSKDQMAIIDAHKMMMEDEELFDQVSHRIKRDQVNGCYSVYSICESFALKFQQMENPYFRERAADMRDIGRQIISAMKGTPSSDLGMLPKGTILVSHDLTPSDTLKIHPESVVGFVTEVGGASSHTAIIARSLGIPAVVKANIMLHLEEKDMLIIDGSLGLLYPNPDEVTKEAYRHKIDELENGKKDLEIYKTQKSITKDGHQVKVVGNIITPEIMPYLQDQGGEGIGLFRSEFMYMSSEEAPTEAAQFAIYKEVALGSKGQEVVIRTLDVGGDKAIDYLKIPKEENPFLGLRAIRYCLLNEAIFKTQIRALLRASYYGDIKIMLPMIGTLEELRQAKILINGCKASLKSEGIPYNEDIKVGIMIEVPSAAILSHLLAKEVDFFSIGTNDLTGYTLAVDLMNDSVAHLYSDYQPSVLSLIKQVIVNGHKEGIEVSMCGSSASNSALIPLYLGMGLDKFSVNPREILEVKKRICASNMKDCLKLVSRIETCGTINEVEKVLC
jgi:phosphotransferase system enzyme I (PtsI)